MEKVLLDDYGINYEKGLKNCMDNPVFLKKILSMFLTDNCFQRAKEAHLARDYKGLFVCMHELKGVSGNVALVDLYDKTVPLVELLRHGTDSDEEVDRLFAAVEASYHRTCEGIDRIIAGA